MKREKQQILQLIYDLFYGSGGLWPSLRDLQRALTRQGDSDVDAARIVQRIPPTLLKPLRNPDGYYASRARLMLTAEGVERCMGSDDDIANLVISVKWLARRAERADLSRDQDETRIPFTTRQLAEAVSLSLESDAHAINRLIAILQVEGWVQDGDATQHKWWTRPLRASRHRGIPWYRAVLGL